MSQTGRLEKNLRQFVESEEDAGTNNQRETECVEDFGYETIAFLIKHEDYKARTLGKIEDFVFTEESLEEYFSGYLVVDPNFSSLFEKETLPARSFSISIEDGDCSILVLTDEEDENIICISATVD